MSARITGMVFDRYPGGGGEFALALALADNAHEDGTHIYPSVATLARKSRQSERTVQYQLRKMQQMRWLLLVRSEERGQPGFSGVSRKGREYRINPDWIKGEALPKVAPAHFLDDSDDQRKGADFAPFRLESNGCNSEHERVQFEARKGATAAAPEPKANQQQNQKRDASAPASEAAADKPPPDPDVLAPFPNDWQPDEACRAILKVQQVPMPETWQVQAFVGHWLGKHIAPRRIPGEFLKWAARERGFAARDARQVNTASGQRATDAADPEQRSQAEKAFEHLRSLNHRGQLTRADCSAPVVLAGLQAMGGVHAFDTVASHDVPKLRARFVAGYCEFQQRGLE